MKKKDIFSKAEIIEGLKCRQFEVYYQPVIDVQENSIVSGEALVRWNHPRLGFLHPASFITIAEDNGAIVELGEFVLREACLQSKEWKIQGYPFFKITVNLSFAQVLEERFTENTSKIIEETGANPKDIEFEITESMAMVDPEATSGMVHKLQDIGIRVTLDDFGAGYSSLSHLRHLPFDGLKIDKQFIQQSVESERGSKLMHSIILLAKSIDLTIVAEGVETKKQLELLKTMGCNTMQGFYFTHPLQSNQYKEWCTFFLTTPYSVFRSNY